MSPAETEYRLAQSLDDYKVRRTHGEVPDPLEYRDELGDAFGEFLDILELEKMLDEVLEPAQEESLPREFGPYTLIRVIGRGAVGIVYEGIHRELGRREAVKVLRRGFDEEGTALERFRQEAKVLARIRHDHIVQIFGAGQVDGRPYYGMTLLEGHTLADLVRLGEMPSPEVTCRGLADVADALQTLHDQGVVHRDVKPSNIILGLDGKMVLADFGLARTLESERITRTGQALGTPLYMSPEQILARRDDVDGRTDVYGLGMTLYEVLAGHPAFQTDDLRALLQMVINERPRPLRKVAPDVPGPCADIVMKTVEKRRRDRYPNAAALRDDLRAFARGERVRGRPVSPLRHVLRRMRTYSLPIAAVVLLALAWGIWYVNRSAELVVNGPEGGTVWIAEESKGTVPLTLELTPDEYVIEYRQEGFEPGHETVRLGAGESHTLRFLPTRPLDPADPDALRTIGKAAGVPIGPFERASEHRGSHDEAAAAVLPAGRVRVTDLQNYYLEVECDDWNGTEAKLRFTRTRDGETKVLHSEPFEPTRTAVWTAIPEAVLAAIEPGDTVTWGVEAASLETRRAEFEVVARDEMLDASIRRLEDVLQNQTPAMRAGFIAQTLLRHDLPFAAWQMASGVTALTDPTVDRRAVAIEKGTELAWFMMRQSLTALEQGSSALAVHISTEVHRDLDPAFIEAWTVKR